MAQDPLSHVASWLTVPAQAGSAGEKVATIEELAAVEFEPVDLSAKFEGSDWFNQWRETGGFIQVAVAYLRKTKPELTEDVASLLGKSKDDRFVPIDWMEDLQTVQRRLRDLVELLHAAEIRFMVASAVFCLRKDGAA